MSAVYGSRTPDLPVEPTGSELLARDRDVETIRRRWELRTAQWRALSLARILFGPGARVRLAGAHDDVPRGLFRALLHMEVPFDGLDSHRAREAVFTRWAREDPVLARIQLVYVFTPRTAVP